MRKKIKIKTLQDLFSKSSGIVKTVNFITLYRIAAAPLLLILLFKNCFILFKWLLLISFFTDAADGYFARKFKVNSILGAKLDSLGDDLTILAAAAGLFKLRFDFIKEQVLIFTALFSLFLIQLIFSLIRYGKMSSFHTYGAKASAIFQSAFLLSMFFFQEPVYFLFYFAALFTALELIEETIIVFILTQWESDVKGLYWIVKKKTN